MQQLRACIPGELSWWGAIELAGRSLIIAPHHPMVLAFGSLIIPSLLSLMLFVGFVSDGVGARALLFRLASALAICFSLTCFVYTFVAALLVCWRNAQLLNVLNHDKPPTRWMIALAQAPQSAHPALKLIERSLGATLCILLVLSLLTAIIGSLFIVFVEGGIAIVPWLFLVVCISVFMLGMFFVTMILGAKAGQLTITHQLESVRQRRALNDDEARGALAIAYDDDEPLHGQLSVSQEAGALTLTDEDRRL